MSCPIRLYPFRKPKNHRLPIPRFKLDLPHGTTHIYTSYIGLQQRSDDQETAEAKSQALSAIQEWFSASDGPSASESFTLIEGDDMENTVVWVCYWVDIAKRNRSLKALNLPSIHSNLAVPCRASIGLWHESFATELSRLETNYSGLDYLPGMARIPSTSTEEHTLSAYWGAARDRIPDSAHDLFPRAADITPPASVPTAIGQHLVGTNHNNLVHIRSGQFWSNCPQPEADSYELNLEPTLRAGLQYLRENPQETGAMGIRYLRNENPDAPAATVGTQHKETCGAGFFRNLADLEAWAKSHPSHLGIWRGALAHYRAFGEGRRFRTWHEVCVVREGEARFEYVNCGVGTGVIGLVPLEVRGSC